MKKNENQQTTPTLTIKSKVKAGKTSVNHNETTTRPTLTIKSKVKAGKTSVNHNETQTRSPSLKVRTR